MLAPSYSEQTEQQHNFTEIVSGRDACAYLGNSKLDTPSGLHELSWEVEASDKCSLALCTCMGQKVLNLFMRGNDGSGRGSSKARNVSRTVQSQASVSAVSVPPPEAHTQIMCGGFVLKAFYSRHG